LVNLQVALCLLLEIHGNPGNQNKRYEKHRSYSPAFSSLTKRKFHASHPEEAARDDAASIQFEKNFREGRQYRKREAAASITPIPRKADAVSPAELPVNQRIHSPATMTCLVIVPCVIFEIVARLSTSGVRSDFSELQFCAALFLGIVLAITFSMHCLVPTMMDRANQLAGLKNASAHYIFRHARPGVAARDLQGGRWTKDWCGGDQQWRTRLSGREWTDRRRSG
jgi:hypothetical protein